MEEIKSETKVIAQQFEDQLVKLHDAYISLHDDFNSYRGVLITEENHKEIEECLMELQAKFNEMYPMLQYIRNRYTVTIEIEKNYVQFIDELKKNGILKDDMPEEAKA